MVSPPTSSGGDRGVGAERRSLSCFSTALEDSTLHLAGRGNSHLLVLLPQQGDVKPDGKISAQMKKE